MKSTDPNKARQDAVEKLLLQELEAQSLNTDICDSETNRSDASDNEYVPSEHSDQEECDHVCTSETDFDGANVTVSGDSDVDSETDGGYKAKNRQIWNKLSPLVSHHRKHNIVIGKPGMTAYSENISSLAETLQLFITDNTLNEICHHTNAEGSSQIPKLWKDISSEKLFVFLGLCIISGILRTRKESVVQLWRKTLSVPDQFFMQQWQEISSFKFFM